MKVYNAPLYYEIAFSFIDAKKQVDLFEKFIKKYSKIRVKCVLDIGCGPSLQLREIAKRGYQTIGLDASAPMLKYLEKKTKEEGLNIETVKADMTHFRLKKRIDFACVMMGTIQLIRTKKEFLTHLDSVAHTLKKGGLYLIENFRLDWANKDFFSSQSWIMERDGIKVKTTYAVRLIETLKQILKETLRLDVDDHGKQIVFKESHYTQMIFPQEFLTLITLNNKFEFIGWFERFEMKRLKKASMDNIIILRRK